MSAHHDAHVLTREEVLSATDRPIGRGVKLANFSLVRSITLMASEKRIIAAVSSVNFGSFVAPIDSRKRRDLPRSATGKLTKIIRDLDPTRPTTGGQVLHGVDVSGFVGRRHLGQLCLEAHGVVVREVLVRAGLLEAEEGIDFIPGDQLKSDVARQTPTWSRVNDALAVAHTLPVAFRRIAPRSTVSFRAAPLPGPAPAA